MLKHAFGRLVGWCNVLVSWRPATGSVARVRDYPRLGGADLLPGLVGRGRTGLATYFEVQRTVGALVEERAAVWATPQQVTELRALLQAVADAQGTDEAQLADIEVHRGLVRTTGNRVYLLLTSTFLQAYLPMRSALSRPFNDGRAAHARLAGVINAISAGAPVASKSAAESYFTTTERIILECLR
ncbi:FadR/GntR family transcriptional regulator [Streptomyces sp. NPDC056534]|uniref:FadR/GntR family transcriptional regulator n=1 Tax=Streptomyces sp. NPDC056534 TaxID=3345857 RepID=UPI0036AAD1E0